MTIRAVSQVSFAKKNQPAQASVKESKNKTSENNSSFKLPGYNVSFGMAKVDMGKLIEKKNLNEKYFTFDENGFIPAAYMHEGSLTELVEELKEVDPNLVIKLFKTKYRESGSTIAHDPNRGVLGVMNESLKNLPEEYKQKGKEALKEIYLTANNEGELPAHTIDRVEDLETMYESVSRETFKKIMKTEIKDEDGDSCSIPVAYWHKDGLKAFVLEAFKDDKDFLKEIFFQGDEKGFSAELNGPEDVAAWCKVFDNNPETLRKKFIKTKEENMKLIEFVSAVSDEESFVNSLHNSLKDTNPMILKDIYSIDSSFGNTFDSLCMESTKKVVAENIFDLITNSDLSNVVSLALFVKNKEFLKKQGIENLDLVEEHLIERSRLKPSASK